MSRSVFFTAVIIACLAGFFAGAWMVERRGKPECPPPAEAPVAAPRPAEQAPSPQSLARIEAKLDRLLLATPAVATDRPPNVLLIICESMNGHSLGFNVPKSAMTPNLDRLAARSVNFRNAISQAGWTSPSMTSIFTGLYPHQHGCAAARGACHKPLASDIISLAAAFRSRGYYAAAFVGRNADWFEPALGGFHHVEISKDVKGAESIDAVVKLLGTASEMPHLILLHIFDPHGPYEPVVEPILPPEITSLPFDPRLMLRSYQAFASEAVSRGQELFYRREIEEVDLRLGKLLEALNGKGQGLFQSDRDILVFTSDHGEEFWYQNGFTEHGRSLHIETIRVPLLFQIPGVAPATVSSYVENAGIYPTLFEVLGWADPRPSRFEAPPSLVPLFGGDDNAEETARYVLSEAIYIDSQNVPGAHEFKTLLRSDGHKLMYDTETKEIRLFDLSGDPGEDRDLARGDRSHPIVAELLAVLKGRTNLDASFPKAKGTYTGAARSLPVPGAGAK